MKKILIIIIMSLMAGNGCYSLLRPKEKQQTDSQNIVQESVVETSIPGEKQEEKTEITENPDEQKQDEATKETTDETVQNTSKPKETVDAKTTSKKDEVQTAKQKSNGQTQSSKTVTPTKQTTQSNTQCNNQASSPNKASQSSNKVDLSKFSYYQKMADGSYKAFLVDTGEINKLKGLINNAINNFGYKNIKLVADSSLTKDGTMYFTANKTNVENAVYDSEGFTIHYYAVKEYSVSQNGTERYFQTRSYIKVK